MFFLLIFCHLKFRHQLPYVFYSTYNVKRHSNNVTLLAHHSQKAKKVSISSFTKSWNFFKVYSMLWAEEGNKSVFEKIPSENRGGSNLS